MKIDNFSPDAVFLRPRNDSVTNTQNNQNTGEDFAALLDETVKNSTSNTSSVLSTLSANTELNQSAQFLRDQSLSALTLTKLKLENEKTPTAEEALKEMEETLSLLENYAIALGDPATSLKDLAPMAEELSFSAKSLDTLSKSLEEGDPEKELSEEIATIAGVEALKFKRGDFV
jgi:hypothetical protein